MAPDFFELIGVTAQGATFETLFWVFVALVGVGLIVRIVRANAAPSEGVLFWVFGIGLLAFGGMQLIGVLQGRLFFGREGFHLPTYGLAMGTGFSLVGVLIYRQAGRDPYGPTAAQSLDLCFWVLVSSIVGARLLFMATKVDHYIELCQTGECLAVLRVWEGGLVWYGGLLGAFAGGWLWCRRNDIPFLKAADLVIPYVPFGHFFGRLGCVGAGCCFGNDCDTPLAINYPLLSEPWGFQFSNADQAGRDALIAAGESFPVHPVQLYEAAGELAIFFLLTLWLRPRKRFDGHLLIAYVGMYSVLRFFVEMFRGDSERGYLIELPSRAMNNVLGLAPDTVTFLSTSQAIGLGLIASCLAAIAWRTRASEARGVPPKAG